MDNSRAYYRHRLEEELAAAERAEDPAIALIHREMAERYRDKIDSEYPLDTDAGAGRPGQSLSAAAI